MEDKNFIGLAVFIGGVGLLASLINIYITFKRAKEINAQINFVNLRLNIIENRREYKYV